MMKKLGLCRKKEAKLSRKESIMDSQVRSEINRPDGSIGFKDFNDLVIEHGYVTMFVVSFPLAPLIAILVSSIALQWKFYKLVHVQRRPKPTSCASIDIILESMIDLNSWLALGTNLSIFSLVNDDVSSLLNLPPDSQTQLLLFILLENILLALCYLGLRYQSHVSPLIRDHVKREKHINNTLKRISHDIEGEFSEFQKWTPQQVKLLFRIFGGSKFDEVADSFYNKRVDGEGLKELLSDPDLKETLRNRYDFGMDKQDFIASVLALLKTKYEQRGDILKMMYTVQTGFSPDEELSIKSNNSLAVRRNKQRYMDLQEFGDFLIENGPDLDIWQDYNDRIAVDNLKLVLREAVSVYQKHFFAEESLVECLRENGPVLDLVSKALRRRWKFAEEFATSEHCEYLGLQIIEEFATNDHRDLYLVFSSES